MTMLVGRPNENLLNDLPRSSVVIVESNEITRAGLRSVLGELAWLRVVGEAGNVAQAVQLCRETQPAVILTDLGLGDASGASVIAALHKVSPGSAIIALSTDQDPLVVVRAIQAGATAFLLRDAPRAALIAAIERVIAGEAFVDRTLAGRVVRAFAVSVATAGASVRPDPLTPREIQVLRSIAQGRSNKEIALDLEMAVGTVKIHVERILSKLSVANRAEATMHAVRLGILDPEEETRARRVADKS